jgi:hypothetical protein
VVVVVVVVVVVSSAVFSSFAVQLVKNLPLIESGDLLWRLLNLATQHFVQAASKSTPLNCRLHMKDVS